MIKYVMCIFYNFLVRCAFVVPTFELDIKQSYPASKKELVQLWNSSLAQPFHFDVFLKAHNATNYKRYKFNLN